MELEKLSADQWEGLFLIIALVVAIGKYVVCPGFWNAWARSKINLVTKTSTILFSVPLQKIWLYCKISKNLHNSES